MCPLSLTEAGEVWLGDQTPQALVDYHYDELVSKPGGPEETAAPDAGPDIEQFLEAEGLLKRDDFKPNKSSRAVIPAPRPVYCTFHYHWENGRKTVGQRVSLKQATYLQSALWKFEHISNEYQRVAFTSLIDDAGEERRAELESDKRCAGNRCCSDGCY